MMRVRRCRPTDKVARRSSMRSQGIFCSRRCRCAMHEKPTQLVQQRPECKRTLRAVHSLKKERGNVQSFKSQCIYTYVQRYSKSIFQATTVSSRYLMLLWSALQYHVFASKETIERFRIIDANTTNVLVREHVPELFVIVDWARA